MDEERDNRQEILDKLIYSAQNENQFTISDLKEYLLAAHVDIDVDFEYYSQELKKRNLLIPLILLNPRTQSSMP